MSFRCFKQALELNPDYAMAYWGMAYTSGIYYNKSWDRMQQDELVEKAAANLSILSRSKNKKSAFASDRDAKIIEALQVRYQSPTAVETEHYDRWNDDYANEMRHVYRAYPDDDDVCTLFCRRANDAHAMGVVELKIRESIGQCIDRGSNRRSGKSHGTGRTRWQNSSPGVYCTCTST